MDGQAWSQQVLHTRQFWGDHYGNVTDQFGVKRAISSFAVAAE